MLLGQLITGIAHVGIRVHTLDRARQNSMNCSGLILLLGLSVLSLWPSCLIPLELK